jgi:signal transduction histidine kinase
LIKYFPLVILLFASLGFSQSSDSIYYYRNLAKNDQITTEDRIIYARKAITLSAKTDSDSTLLNSQRVLSFLYIIDGQIDNIKSINLDNLSLAKKIKDSVSIANAYYNLGYSYGKTQKVDSAYYYYFNAVKLYDKLEDFKNYAAVLLNMANIQESERDYIGAQNNVIKAINVVDKLQKNDYNVDTEWSLYNLIGIISGELQQYDNSIEYHNKAINSSNKLKDNYFYKIYSNVNIASTYRKKGDYNLAIDKYNQILESSKLLSEDASTYAYVINDLAYSKFLRGKDSNKEIETLYRQAFRLSDSISDKNIKMSVSLNFSDYFKTINQLDSAAIYSTTAYSLGKELKHNKTILKALYIKSEIEKGEPSKKYLFEHIRLNDSLLFAERSSRNKFMRIDYETEEIKQENQQISRQRLWLLIVSGGLLFTLFFLYIIKTQREKNKELQLERQQQEANEEIYKLMLSQQDKIDEARSLEKNRISKDIHDGILGKLFGVRLSLDGLNLSVNKEAIDKRSHYISELKNIEEDIRKVSHELNTDFIKQSGFLDIVKTLVDAQMNAYKIEYTFYGDDSIDWDALNNKVKIHLYRILQETMQNAYKHAEATKVDISFKMEANALVFCISDNGKGFDTHKAKKGIGLKNIEDRIQEINGELKIKSHENTGTKIIIIVPTINN